MTFKLIIGITIALIAEIFGAYANIQMKVARRLLKTNKLSIKHRSSYEIRSPIAADKQLFKLKRFWVSVLLFVGNILFNVMSLMFASLDILAPTYSLTIIINAILAEKYFNENLTYLGKLGSFFIIIGSIMAVLFGNNDEREFDINDIELLASKTVFILFGIIYILLICLFLLIEKLLLNIITYTIKNDQRKIILLNRIRAVCYGFSVGSIGAWVQFFAKLLGDIIEISISQNISQFHSFGSWIIIVIEIILFIVQILMISNMMDSFDAILIVPLFDSAIILGMIILEWIFFGITSIEHFNQFLVGIFTCLLGMIILTMGQHSNNNHNGNITSLNKRVPATKAEISPLMTRNKRHNNIELTQLKLEER